MLRIVKRFAPWFYFIVLRKSFYIHWSAKRSPRVHEVNPGGDLSKIITRLKILGNKNIFGVSKVSQTPEYEFSLIKIEFPRFVVEVHASIRYSWEKGLVLKSLT